MAVLAMVSSGHPVSGGTYFYGSRFFSPVAAFTGVWAYVLGAVLGMFPLFALTGARFLQWVFPALPLMPTALALLLFFYLTNLFGVKLAMWVQAVMVGVLFVALFVFLGAGLPRVDLASFRPLFTGGVGGFAVASAILTFTVLGANAAVELGDEIVAPERTIPRSFLVSIPVVTAIYVAIAVVVAGVGSWTGEADEALTGIAATFLSRPLFLFFIFGGGFLAVVTTLNATYLWGTKSLLLIAEDGLLPRGLAAVNRRFGTPHWLLTAIAALSCVSLVRGGRLGGDLRDLRVAGRHHHLHPGHDRGPAPAPALSRRLPAFHGAPARRDVLDSPDRRTRALPARGRDPGRRPALARAGSAVPRCVHRVARPGSRLGVAAPAAPRGPRPLASGHVARVDEIGAHRRRIAAREPAHAEPVIDPVQRAAREGGQEPV